MLNLNIPGTEYYNEETEEFTTVGDIELVLEHSLISLSKWESKHKRPFLAKDTKTPDEILSYIESMILTPVYPKDIFRRFKQVHIDQINAYIDSTESATTFGHMPKHSGRGEVITSELIYYWMVAFTIPFECECWHLNRLFALIRICNIKQQKPKRMGRHELASRNRQLNEQRKAQYNTSG
jgi:hypothetical protein